MTLFRFLKLFAASAVGVCTTATYATHNIMTPPSVYFDRDSYPMCAHNFYLTNNSRFPIFFKFHNRSVFCPGHDYVNFVDFDKTPTRNDYFLILKEAIRNKLNRKMNKKLEEQKQHIQESIQKKYDENHKSFKINNPVVKYSIPFSLSDVTINLYDCVDEDVKNK